MLLFFDQIRLGANPGRGKNRSQGGSLLHVTFSSYWKATAANRMDNDDLEAFGKKCSILVLLRSQIFDAFLTSFWT